MNFRRAGWTLLAATVLTAGAVTVAPPAAAGVGDLAPQAVVPPDGDFFPLASPQRFLDTRPGTGGTDPGTGQPRGIGGWTGRLGVSQTINVTIAGRFGVPAANLVRAVAMNVTVVDPTGSGFVTIWPGDQGRPDSSSVNYSNGVNVPNFVIVPVGANGEVNAYNGANDGAARGHLLFDVVGYYVTASSPTFGGYFAPFAQRFFDSRNPAAFAQRGAGSVDFLRPGEWRTVRDTQYDPNFPTYVFNVTITEPSADGFLSVVPGNRVGSPPPSVSSHNFRRGNDIANMVFVTPDSSGTFSIYNGGAGALHVIFDFVGVYDDSTVFTSGAFVARPAGPFRFSDSRTNLNRGALVQGSDGFTVTLDIAADARIPADADALIVNVTVVDPSAKGYLTLFEGPTRPDTSTVNFNERQVIPNLSIVRISPDRKIRFFVSRGVDLHVILDVMGWIE